MMKKLFCALLVLLMVGCVSAAMAEQCEYGTPESPCDIGWQIDHAGQMHRRVCTNHVENKEDPFSYMPVTDWESCTPDADGECTVCGHDYIREPVEPDPLPEDEMFIMMLEEYLAWCEENGVEPFQASASGSKLTLRLTDAFQQFADEWGYPVTEAMLAKSTGTLTLTNGLTYPATGKAVEPEVELIFSEYGPGKTMLMMGMLSVDGMEYYNNVEPGTAIAEMYIYLMPDDVFTLQQKFTITGEGGGEGGEDDTLYCKYGSASSPCEIVWDANSKLIQHSSYCIAHLEDKEDMYSYVQVTDWEDCTLNGNQVCTVCGANYAPDEPETPDYDADMVEIYNKLLERNGVPPLEIAVSGNEMIVGLSEQFIMYMMEYGIPTEAYEDATTISIWTMDANYNYTDSFEATGEAICPLVSIESTGKGGGEWADRSGLLSFGSPTYENNVEPGTAKVKIQVSVVGGVTYTLVYEFTIVGAVDGEYCIYGGPTSPCDIIWSVRSDERIHRRVCRNHREKEDYEQMIPVTEWEPCTPGEGGVCTGCGYDYDKSDNEMTEQDILAYMVEYYCRTAAEFDEAINATVSGNELSFSMRDEYLGYLEEGNVPVLETMRGSTAYTLVLTGGSEFAATGEPITPAVEVQATENGPGHWLEDNGLMNICAPVYANNVEPGTGTVSVTFEFTMGIPYTITAEFTILGEGPFCKYGSPSSPCDIRWAADGDTKQHYSYCVNHVEDKEDMYSYVKVTDWENCTFTASEYICDTCGADYNPEEEPDDSYNEAVMVELYFMLLEKKGVPPVEISVKDNYATVALGEQLIMYMMEYGIPVTESLQAKTVYSLTLRAGTEFPYTGEAVEPEAGVDVSSDGPGAWMEKYNLLSIGDVVYENNVEPGSGCVYVEIEVNGTDAFALIDYFTITGEAADRLPGDASGDDKVDINDAICLLDYLCSGNTDINQSNADVNGDGKVDANDALRILQYDAGWDVKLN